MTVGHELDAPPWSRVEGTLLSTARAVRRAYDAALAELGVNLSEASVLAHLRDSGPLTQTDLARRIGTGRARMGAWIDGLVAQGAVVREADPHDRRVWKVVLTPEGHVLWEETARVDRSIRRVLREGTTAEDRARLDALLTVINRNADKLAGTTRSH
jgi:MarR family transcriptional regulator for hemolysin